MIRHMQAMDTDDIQVSHNGTYNSIMCIVTTLYLKLLSYQHNLQPGSNPLGNNLACYICIMTMHWQVVRWLCVGECKGRAWIMIRLANIVYPVIHYGVHSSRCCI